MMKFKDYLNESIKLLKKDLNRAINTILMKFKGIIATSSHEETIVVKFDKICRLNTMYPPKDKWEIETGRIKISLKEVDHKENVAYFTAEIIE